MQFKDTIISDEVKKELISEVKSDRISHAQMFIGPEGSGKLPMAIAFAQYLMCENPGDDDSCGTCDNCQKIDHLAHPDLHFSFPVVISKTNKVAVSDDRRQEWNEMILRKKYFNVNQWQEFLGEEGKNAIIGTDESRQILKKLSLKSYSGKYKIMIIWLPEAMNNTCANKLLKILEEPPEKTIFLLVSDNQESLLPTILSRTQFIRVPAIATAIIENYLVESHGVSQEVAHSVAALSQGNIIEAIQLIEGDNSHHIYFDLFVKLMRAAYSVKPNELIAVSEEIAQLDKQKQKNFLKYGLHIFRESIISNYMKGKLINVRADEKQFLDKFARFINNQNIVELSQEFNSAHYHLERNANPKILFTDLVIKLTKLIKKGV